MPGTRKEQAQSITDDLFDMFDTEKDGKITECELLVGLRQIGNVTGKELRDIYDKCGVEFGKPLTKAQFGNCIEFYVDKKSNATLEEEEAGLIASFKIFDKDGNDSLDKNELRTVLTKIGDKMTRTEVDTIFTKLDTNRDGKIEIKEFVKLCLPTTPKTTKTTKTAKTSTKK